MLGSAVNPQEVSVENLVGLVILHKYLFNLHLFFLRQLENTLDLSTLVYEHPSRQLSGQADHRFRAG